VVIAGLALLAPETPAGAADICEAVALRNAPALEAPSAVIRRGDLDTAITQYRVSKKTGEDQFCSHGGYCYPVHALNPEGQRDEAPTAPAADASAPIGSSKPFATIGEILTWARQRIAELAGVPVDAVKRDLTIQS